MGVTAPGERMFLAVAFDEESRHAIATHLETQLEGRRLPGRRVPVENWHITLRFLGSTSALQRDRLLAYLDQHLVAEPFRISFTVLGGFPRESKASVVWLGAGGDVDSLRTTATICEEAAVEAGFEPEGRPFHPHLTLARVRPPADVRSLVDLVEPTGVKLDVDAVTLYRSVLGSGPVRYEVVDTIDL